MVVSPNLPDMSDKLHELKDECISFVNELKRKCCSFFNKSNEETSVDDILSDITSDGLYSRKWIIIAVLVALLFLSGCSAAILLSDSSNLASSNEEIIIQVRPGDNARIIAEKLEDNGVIPNRHKFFWYAKWLGEENNFKTGAYIFHGNMDMNEVINALVSGSTSVARFTIPEGFGVKEIAERLEQEGIADKNEFLKKAKDFAPYSYMKKQKDVRYAAEGFLFPDTYTVEKGTDVDQLLEIMAKDMDERLTPELRERAQNQNLTIYELITLASLVEKEARYDEDRPIIAQVFFKRLEIGMPLQTDASLQYLLDEPKEDVSIADTKIESPYNTYQNMGLPPGPIASPGMKAIEAVLYPADTNYLYFVADRDGHNHYSDNYSTHLDLVDQVR